MAELNNEMLRHTHSVNNAGFKIQRNLRKKGLVFKTETFCCHRRHFFIFSDLRRTLTFVYILEGCKVVGGFSLKEKRQGNRTVCVDVIQLCPVWQNKRKKMSEQLFPNANIYSG